MKKSIEFVEKVISGRFTTLSYWKGEDQKDLLLSIPDLLDYLYKSDCIQDYELPPYHWNTKILLEGVDDPMGPEQEQRDYSEWVSLACYMDNVFDDARAMKVVLYHESKMDSERVIGTYFPQFHIS